MSEIRARRLGRPCGFASPAWTIAVRCGRESTISASNRLENSALRLFDQLKTG